MIPGEYRLRLESISINSGREAVEVDVINRGDRPVQVGSHFHFAEANQALEFDRQAAYGRRLDIPAGTAARFEPGDSKTVRLVEMAGNRQVFGLSNAVNGPLKAGPSGGTNGNNDGGAAAAEGSDA
jgi:urease subunit beta